MEDGAQEQAAQQPQQESGETQEKDYKALYEEAVKESRKWEKRSKGKLLLPAHAGMVLATSRRPRVAAPVPRSLRA